MSFCDHHAASWQPLCILHLEALSLIYKYINIEKLLLFY